VNWLTCLLDFTARAGALQAQDDHGPALLGGVTPYELLEQGLHLLGLELHDERQTPRKGRGRARGTRKLEDCTAQLWHQTAAEIRTVRQALGIPVHCTILSSGDVVLLHPLRAYLWHAGAANKFAIGVEVSCRAAGIEGDERTFWRSRKEIKRGDTYAELVREATDVQLAAGVLVGAYYCAEVKRQRLLARMVGAGLVACLLHRNTAKSRVSDPGSRIALGVAKPVAEAHGLEYGEPVVGSGHETPAAWGGAPRVPYSWRVRGY